MSFKEFAHSSKLQNLLVYCCSVTRSSLMFATPWTTALQASLSFTISQSLLKLMSIESVMSSNHLMLCHPLFLLPSVFPSIRVFSSELALHIRWPKCWSLSFSISPSKEYSGLIPLELTCLISLLSKGLSRVFSSTTIGKHQFLGTQPSLCSNSQVYWKKNIVFTIWIFVCKVVFLLFSTLSRFFTALFPRSKGLLPCSHHLQCSHHLE